VSAAGQAPATAGGSVWAVNRTAGATEMPEVAEVPGAPLIVRSATAGDLPAIVACLVAGSLEPHREEPSDLEPYRLALAECQGGRSDVLVAEADGEVVGVCQLIVFRHLQRRGALCAELESVHVRPDRRSAGIGATLAGAAIERARALGCARVQLTSNLVRHDAHRFWEHMGFVRSHAGFKLPLTDRTPPRSTRVAGSGSEA
jgi:GNAT superfamily N-acetyltransferase